MKSKKSNKLLQDDKILALSKLKAFMTIYYIFLIAKLAFYPFTIQTQLLKTQTEKPIEDIVGKGENANNQHFLLFSQCFLPSTKQISNFLLLLFCCLHMLSNWTSL